MNQIYVNIVLLFFLALSSLLFLRAKPGKDIVFSLSLGFATLAAVVAAIMNNYPAWHTGFAATIWASIAITLVFFVLLVVIDKEAWRLSFLLSPYLFLLGLFALFGQSAPDRAIMGGDLPPSLFLHIIAAVLTYSLCTLAALAALAAFIKEGALKKKKIGGMAGLFPAVSESESLYIRLLFGGEIVLGLGLLSGILVRFLTYGDLLRFDHKTLLSILAFIVIAGILAAHHWVGIRGRLAARVMLLGYLLLTLAYPGVKFVTGVLLGK